jgi:hypothetical protein
LRTILSPVAIAEKFARTAEQMIKKELAADCFMVRYRFRNELVITRAWNEKEEMGNNFYSIVKYGTTIRPSKLWSLNAHLQE